MRHYIAVILPFYLYYYANFTVKIYCCQGFFKVTGKFTFLFTGKFTFLFICYILFNRLSVSLPFGFGSLFRLTFAVQFDLGFILIVYDRRAFFYFKKVGAGAFYALINLKSVFIDCAKKVLLILNTFCALFLFMLRYVKAVALKGAVFGEFCYFAFCLKLQV